MADGPRKGNFDRGRGRRPPFKRDGGDRGPRRDRGDRDDRKGGRDKERKSREEPVFPDNPPLERARLKARAILRKRTSIHDDFEKLGIWKKEEIENDRAENDRLSDVFAYNESQLTPEAKKKAREDKAYSDIAEAMLYDVSQKLFAGTDVAVVLPSELDDRKSAVDLMLAVKNKDGRVKSAIAIDATTETDVEGYDDGEGGKKKGLEDKFKRSYRNVFTSFGNLMRVKYADVDGVKQRIENAPRVLAGISQAEIRRLATKWTSDDADISKEPIFAQIVQSIPKQLGAILLAVHDKETEKKKKTINERKRIEEAYKDISAAVPAAMKERIVVTDPVVKKILAVTGLSFRERMRGEAHAEQAVMNEEFENWKSEWKKPLEEKLSDKERVKLDAHYAEHSVPAEAKQMLEDFLAGARKDFDPKWIGAVSGGIPTRVHRRLKMAPKRAVPTPEPIPTPVPTPALHPAPHTPHGAHGPEAHGAHDVHHEHADVHGHMAAIAKARAGLGLSASHGHDAHGGGHDAHGGGHAGAHGHESHGHGAGGGIEKYQSKWKRAWSKTKELVLRRFAGLGGGVIGTGIGTLACMGFWTVLPAFAGAALSQWGLNKWFKKKGYDKKFEARDKIAALESLEKDMKAMPWSWRHKFEQAAKKGEDKDTWIQNELVARAKWSRLRRNVLSAAVGGAAGLEFGSVAKSGESLFFKRLPEVAQGKRSWSDAWGVFCAGDWWNRRPAPRGPLGAPGVHGPGTGRNGFVPLTRGGFVDPFNQFDGARRRPTFRELMGCCLQQNTELARVDSQGNPWYRIRTTVPGAARPGHIAGLASGRWN